MHFLNKNLSIKKSNLFLWLIIFTIILLTNSYFSVYESLENGAKDGATYLTISDTVPYFFQNYPDNSPYVLQDLPSHKAWRFFVPYSIGVLSKAANINIYFVYQVFSLIILLHLIYVLDKKVFNSNSNTNLIFILCIIFNPYFIRYYISLPLLINDILFIYATSYIVIFLKTQKKYFFFIGLILACLVRQESIFILPALLFCKFFYKDKSIFDYRLILLSIILIIIIFSLNFNYSINVSGSGTGDGYSFDRRFALFFGQYSYSDLIEFILFFLMPFFFPFLIIIFYFKNFKNNFFKKIKNENLIFLIILSILIIIPAILAGPTITGKNAARLTNLTIIPLTYIIYLVTNDIKIKKKFLFLFIFFGLISLQHPTYSISKFFSFLI